MTTDIITIGDELLIGQVVNTNAAWIAQQLNLIGFRVNRMVTVSDSKSEIIAALREANQHSDVVVITGGLGPTSDDITKPVLCEYFNTSLRFDEEVYRHVESYVLSLGGTMNELNKAQANVPVDCIVLPNYIGTAAGMWFEKEKIVFVSLPGVPFEMEKLMSEQVLPKLQEKFHISKIFHRTILTQGIGESRLAETILEWEKQLPPNLKLAFLPSPGIVKLRLSVYNDENGGIIVAREEKKLLPLIMEYVYGYDDDTLESIIGKYFRKNEKTLSTAESCTSGNIARLITSVSGSSDYFKGGIVAYANEIKVNELGVPQDQLDFYGAVSKQVVELMAIGVIKKFKTDYSIAVSGIAGPTGGSTEKPVGTVWIAVANESKVVSNKYSFGNSRERNVTRATITALNMLRKFIIGELDQV
jgi:nicotinamide-nucleotide amidase